MRQELLEQAVAERTDDLHQRTLQLEEAREETLQRLALAAEFRDDATFVHTRRVGRTAGLIAVQLGLPESEIRLIREAAPLHDVGKVGVSDSILLKPGPLTPDELRQARSHAATGAAILSGSKSDVLQIAEEIAHHHHEWWNGCGYPVGLKGEAIPLSARIVAVADVFDALTHDRPYKGPWPVPTAVAEIHRLAGHQFDPRVVGAFDRLDPYDLVDPAEIERAEANLGDGRLKAIA